MPESDSRYRISPALTLAHRAPGLLPPAWREHLAEHRLRRPRAPGPASEHVLQYLLSAARASRTGSARQQATIAHGADLFYERQYRQYLNATMGAFAMTATQALVASGGAPRGRLWWRRRTTYAALLEEIDGCPPILVLDRETVAIPIFVPRPRETDDVETWLAGKGRMPECLRDIVAGQEIRCAEPGVRARERTADGAVLEVADAALQSKKLALLALHPHDPDAMGLHITLFGVEIVAAERLAKDYGLEPAELYAYRKAARTRGRLLAFFVGGTEETFTQCSQNLFVKRPAARPAAPARAMWPDAWDPRFPLERLLASQFEMIQVTVSADGLPGASPRNGDLGRAAFMARRGTRPVILIPYYPGNSVHGHAAKLWSNSHGTLVVSDDHTALTRVTISGPAQIIAHAQATKWYPEVAARVRRDALEKSATTPEYWFVQDVTELVQQQEPLAANSLDPQRPTCSIHAGGQAKHGKKPAYFAADTLPPYDHGLQHEREAAGRPTCPSGMAHRHWLETVDTSLTARRAHLEAVRTAPLQSGPAFANALGDGASTA